MKVSYKKRILIRKRRFYRRLFALLLFITIIGITIFIRCSANYKFTVCIDPGHGGYDPGATNSIYRADEKDIVLDVSLRLAKILRKEDIKVIYTRKKDKVSWENQRESLSERSKISNKSNADIFISIHANNFVKDTNVKGTEVWCRFKNTEDEILAKEISNELSSIGYTKDRGLKYEEDKELYVLKNTQATSVLVELGYMSNPEDLKFLMSKEGKNKCAEAIAQAIINYYKTIKIEE
ncbi:N-acetylmuramoyl-L-alanine amidase family protein [Maledivibacter halophilus]|uniref:N-acetylmuramoyl-L-alanine amidase n=1 Tax=Maledivibacter halophilus TaxID=36842 RepID=A0A1T5IC39_9FIRM|nr:N-acetylmuramoyl-L-alanine amidase [Maledivibacter halophilus]SKC36751.1 N-acetylmuramoyl-L-alanine amidase [Maledivibacter halophilus]